MWFSAQPIRCHPPKMMMSYPLLPSHCRTSSPASLPADDLASCFIVKTEAVRRQLLRAATTTEFYLPESAPLYPPLPAPHDG